jgi:hypothetical protein
MMMGDLYPELIQKASNNGRRIVATYDYRDEASNLLFQVVRFEPKDFRQRRPEEGGRWKWSVKGVRVVPYRLPEFLSSPDFLVIVVEGEKDVDNLARLGVLATCNAGGAGKWTADHARHLAGRVVVIIPDNDDTGRSHAQQVAASLHGVAQSVRIVELPGLPPKGDVSDWIAAGGTKDDLAKLIEATPKSVTSAAVEQWPEIESLDEMELPEFPTDSLPPVLRDWVSAESHATQTPPDLAALLALAVCSATIARRVEVEPRAGFREPVNVYVAVLLAPANRKSAVFRDAMKPIRELEAELIEAARPLFAREQSRRRQNEARLKKLEKDAVEKDDPEARFAAAKLAEELAQQPEPVLPRLIVDDATSEKLGMVIAEQGGRLASMSPEGGVFDLMAGLYSKSGIPQFDVYLKGHSGDDLITDRVSRKSVSVSRPALTCAYAMQPQVIDGLAENPAFRGRGLLARFLYAAPKSWIGRREIAPEPVPEATRTAYWQIVRKLAALDEEFTLRFTPEALQEFQNWEAEIEEMLADGGQMEGMPDWGGKLAGETLRLAAIIHFVDHRPETAIDQKTIVAAIEIAEYLIPHAEAVLNMMEAADDDAVADAGYVLKWIRRHQRREFTKTEVQHHGKRRFPKAEDIDPALSELTLRGYIRPRTVEQAAPGRPPSPTYDVNPAVFQNKTAESRSHNSHKSDVQPESTNSGNIGSAFEDSEGNAHMQVTV